MKAVGMATFVLGVALAAMLPSGCMHATSNDGFQVWATNDSAAAMYIAFSGE